MALYDNTMNGRWLVGLFRFSNGCASFRSVSGRALRPYERKGGISISRNPAVQTAAIQTSSQTELWPHFWLSCPAGGGELGKSVYMHALTYTLYICIMCREK